MDSLPSEILLAVDSPALHHASQVFVQWRQLSLKQVKEIKIYQDFITCCRQGDQLSIVRSKFNCCWINKGLGYSCRGGHKELVELLIVKGANDCNSNLYYDCSAGHSELVELLIANGASDWNKGLFWGLQT